ncbi:hypothetical protein CXB51_020406 [Gossypium anomalum]|uniref:Uncharacterized protein n=1 Tax=Gossypium anomalum TaxID=47600 RepID=A0A8J5ZEW7_9ROSI|nr:hypothetical protein CXB51_020406 [Gossypium anomalum]
MNDNAKGGSTAQISLKDQMRGSQSSMGRVIGLWLLNGANQSKKEIKPIILLFGQTRRPLSTSLVGRLWVSSASTPPPPPWFMAQVTEKGEETHSSFLVRYLSQRMASDNRNRRSRKVNEGGASVLVQRDKGSRTSGVGRADEARGRGMVQM